MISIEDKIAIILDDDQSDEIISHLVPSVWKIIYSPINYHDHKDIECYIHFNNEKYRNLAIDKLIAKCNKEINHIEEMLALSLDVTNEVEDSCIELWKNDIKEQEEYISFFENNREKFVKDGILNIDTHSIRVWEVKL